MIKVKSKPKENANTVRKKNRWKDFRDNAELSALMIPGIVLLLVFAYVPMLGIIIAFKDYRNNYEQYTVSYCVSSYSPSIL